MAWGQQLNNSSLINNTIKQLKENSIQSLFLIPAFMPINESNVMEFKEGLEQNTSLTELYMHGHQLGEEGSKEIGKCIENHKNLKTISIGSLDIGLNIKEFELLLSGILKSKVLKNIDFSKQSINKESLKSIKKILEANGGNKMLEYLNFGENEIDSESLIELSSIIVLCENIETLNIGGNQITTGIPSSFIDTLINNGKSLKKLVFSANCFKNDNDDNNSCMEISRLLLNSTSLKEIELNDCELTEIGSKHIGDSILNWKGNSFTATGNSMIKSSFTSSWLDIKSPIGGGGVCGNNLKHLSLRGCFIGDQGVKGIMNAINTNNLTHLNLLDVAYNQLSLESLNSLGQLVVVDDDDGNKSHSMEYLDISFNLFGRETKDIVCKWISSNKITHLKCLSLNNTGMKFMDTFEICKTLAENHSTTTLKLFEVLGNDERDDEQTKKEEEIQNQLDEKLKLKQQQKNQHDEDEEEESDCETDENDVYQILSDNINILKNQKKLDFKWK